MAAFIVEKTRNNTVMSNQHLRDRAEGKGTFIVDAVAARGLGLRHQGIGSYLQGRCGQHLRHGAGYIVRKRERRADGTLGRIEYAILEQPRQTDAPKRAFPEQVKPEQEKPEQEKPTQLNMQEGFRLPNLMLPQEPSVHLGKYAELLRQYLKQHCRVLYTNLKPSGQLAAYLAEIEEMAQRMVRQIVTQTAQAEGVT